MNPRTAILSVAALVAAVSALPAQHLRQGLAHARYVCVARHVGVQPLGNELFVHRYEVIEALRGEPAARFTIVERKRVADTPKPQIGPDRLLCLVDDRRTELPERFAPTYRLTGFRGDHPVVDDSPAYASLRRLADTLLASQQGTDPAATTGVLVDIALRGNGIARAEAARALRERPVLRDELDAFERDALLSAAIGESDDIMLKLALAELAVDANAEGAVRALCVALPQCDHPRFAVKLGQLAALEHGEKATAVLRPFLDTARGATRDRVLLAIGATRTTSALRELLQMRERQGASDGLDAALRQHGAARALEVLRAKRDG